MTELQASQEEARERWTHLRSGVVYSPLDRKGAWKMDPTREHRSAGFAIDLNQLLIS